MSWTTERARTAALHRHRSADDPDLLAAQAALRDERAAVAAEDYVNKLLACAPALTPALRERLRPLLSDRAEAGAA